ncbi:hypothetical protein ACFL27_23010 [candidate division CSSED10-310 bacterium]|uniref:CPBP family intramembrane metalloprotease n=1 Tax=candidate division CSSED10-310 bacterium TaxID=2855610 RepID=A0ABV6Z409_UNCC1
MTEKLNKNDSYFIILCLIILISSFWFSSQNFQRAFPEASIDFQLTREEAAQKAEQFLKQVCQVPPDYHQITIFDYDAQAKVFLEREVGIDEANELFDQQVKVWKWSTRWFQPLSREEFTVDITPSGSLMSFTHLVKEDAPGASLESESGLSIAQKFLTEHISVQLSQLNTPEIKTEKREHRIDHSFTWTRNDLTVGEASYRHQVVILGDTVGGYAEGLHIPEDWIRDYTRLRSYNETAGTVDSVVTSIAFICLVVILVLQLRARNIQWGVASAFGFIGFILSLLNHINAFPISLYGYITTESYGAFLSKVFIRTFLISLSLGTIIFLLVAAAETLYRKDFPKMIAVRSLFSWRSIRSKKFFKNILLGYTLAGLFLAYQIIFYLVAESFGAWSPADIPYSNILNTAFPWIAVIFIGFFPAVTEEFFHRVFLISFLRRLVRFRFLAVVIAALIWGFGHASYPNQPFYIRGIEVGFIGIVFGLIFLRYGILPLLVWHYTIDAFYTALVLCRSSNMHYFIMSIFTTGFMLVPFFISLCAYLKTRTFLPTAELTHATIGSVEYKPVRKARPALIGMHEYMPLRKSVAFITLGILLLIQFFFFMLPETPTVQKVNYKVTPTLVQDRADYFLTKYGGELAKYQSVVYLTNNFVRRVDESDVEEEDLPRFNDDRDDLALTYIFQKGGVSVLNTILKKIPDRVWAVRYYQEEQKEEWRFYLKPHDGSLLRFMHLLPKDDPGSQLSEGEALARATTFLQSQGLHLQQFELKEHETRKQKQRNDYTFTWEALDPFVGQARERIFLLLRGNSVGEFKRYVKIPEDWEWERQGRDVLFYIRYSLQTLVMVIFSFSALWIIYWNIRKETIHWGIIFRWATIPTAFVILNVLNVFPITYAHYPTAITFDTFLIDMAARYTIDVIISYFIFVLCFILVDSLYPLTDSIVQTIWDKVKARDAIVSLIIAGLFGITIEKIQGLMQAKFSALSPLPPVKVFEELDLPIPLLQPLEDVFFWALLGLAILRAGRYIHQRLFQNRVLLVLGAVALAMCLVPLDIISSGEYLFSFLNLALYIFVALFIVFFIFKRNMFAYPLVFFLLPLLKTGYEFFLLDNSFYKANGVVLFLVCFCIFLFPLKAMFSGRGESEQM